MARTVALLVAAGRGQRAGGEIPKQFRMLDGLPVLRRSCNAFLGHPAVDAVQVVIHADDGDRYDRAVGGLGLRPAAVGGATRQDSCRLGLEALAAGAAPDRVLIHDAARPLVDRPTIDRVLAALDEVPGAVAAVPVADTLKRADASDCVAATVDRNRLWRAQTPQGFRFAEILSAHRNAAGLSLTDDAAVAERAGMPVRLVAGSEDNLKITTEDDFRRAGMLLSGADLRVGTGFDVHRFGPGDSVVLCGVTIPHDHGLQGHSDADVGLHALSDAILGAVAEGDIGSHFPPADPRWRGADSAGFLRHAVGLVAARAGEIRHLDVTLICERPKVGPHRPAMRARIADIAGVPEQRVSVKATTTDGLGFTGRGEGIAAQATATVRL